MASHTPEMRAKRISLLKTCHIITVQVGHLHGNMDGLSDDELIVEFEEHWADILTLPNLKIARAQIERNSTGILHINGGLVFSKPVRASTLMNRAKCWADPADNKDAVMQYGKKKETRVAPLENFGVLKLKKSQGQSPKELAIDMLVAGATPPEICAKYPSVFFTHHRAILETYNMMKSLPMANFQHPEDDLPLEEE